MSSGMFVFNSLSRRILLSVFSKKIVKHIFMKIQVFERLQKLGIVLYSLQYRFKQSQFHRSHKLYVTLSSVTIASKWDEPEKIKVFIVSTIRRKVLWSQKGERRNCTKSKKCGAIQCSLGKEKRTMCNYPGETLLLAT